MRIVYSDTVWFVLQVTKTFSMHFFTFYRNLCLYGHKTAQWFLLSFSINLLDWFVQ